MYDKAFRVVMTQAVLDSINQAVLKLEEIFLMKLRLEKLGLG